MKRISIALLGATAMAAALPAAAQSNMLSSVYIGGDVGQSKLKKGCEILGPGCDDKHTSWGVFAGYRFHPNFSAELGYHNLGKFSSSLGGDVKANAWELDAIGSWPLSNQFSVYGKLGGYRGELKNGGSETNTDLTYGLGLQWDFTRNVGVRGEWQRYPKMGGGHFGTDTDLDVLRVAALWRFQ